MKGIKNWEPTVGETIILQKCKHKFLNGQEAVILKIDKVKYTLTVQSKLLSCPSEIGLHQIKTK